MSPSTLTPDPAAGRAASKPCTALVLAGGAALGAMQAGMVHVPSLNIWAASLSEGHSRGTAQAASPGPHTP